MAKGGIVPAMVMPGEHIFTPNEASKIGKGKLDYINQNGKLPGYFWGGNVNVPGGQPGGKAVNAQGAAVFGAGVPNQNGQWFFVPNGVNPWGANMPLNQGAVQNQNLPRGANANAGAIPVQGGFQNQVAIEQEFQQAMAANQMDLDRSKLLKKKAEFYQLRNKLQSGGSRSKEDVARFRELYKELTNPFLIQADRAQRLVSAQEALSKFEKSPKDFLDTAKNLRQTMLSSKLDYQTRLMAKEMYEEYVLAARSIPPQALRAAMAGKNNQPNNEILDREWAQRRQAVAAHNIKMEEKYGNKPTGAEAVAAHNAKMEEKYGKEISGPEAVAAHNAKMKEKYGVKPTGPEAVKSHNEKVRAAEEARRAEAKNAEPTEIDKAIMEARKERGKTTEIDKAISEERARQAAEANKPKELTEIEKSIREERARKEAELAKTKDQGGTEIDKAIRAARERKNADANLAKRAAGGIVPGVGSGDIVPAMLEPGELVVPKKHVQKFASGGIVGGIQGFANGGMAQGGPELLDVAAKFNQAATQISQGLSGFSTSVSTFNGAVANFGTFVDKFDEAVGKIPGQIELSGANEISVNLMGQDSIVKAVTEAIGPMIAEAIRANQPVEQRSQ
jgi:hypothetical protein